MKLKSVFLCICILSTGVLLADEKLDAAKVRLQAIADQFKYQQGTVVLKDGLAKLAIPDGFQYLDSKQSETLLEKLWANPSGKGTLGMLLPNGISPLDEKSWGVVITYEEDGYVKDDDAEKINYVTLLKEMQESTKARNEERVKQGYPSFELVGWAVPPRYDKATHKLYWAKELKIGDQQEHTLNYNIRILGRQGVLVLNAVSSMQQLQAIEQDAPKILSFVEFNEGKRYADFKPGTDKVAAYGIAGLVAGGILAKTGLLKGLWIAILAAKKFIIIGVAAIGAWISKFFKRKQDKTTVSL